MRVTAVDQLIARLQAKGNGPISGVDAAEMLRLIKTSPTFLALQTDITNQTKIIVGDMFATDVTLVSGNAGSVSPVETINTFDLSQYPDNQPIRFYPEAGLEVTFTHGTSNSQPRCFGAANAVIDGTKGEWIEFTKINGQIFETNVGMY